MPADQAIVEFRAYAKQIPNALIARGERSLGTIDLARLVQLIDEAPMRPTDWIFRPQKIGTGAIMRRSSAQWTVQRVPGRRVRYWIDLNVTLWEITLQEAAPLIALHEFIGVYGALYGQTAGAVDDENYVATTVAALLAEDQTHAILTDEELKQLRDQIRILYAGGGVTVVGGGGDFTGPYGKLRDSEESLRHVAAPIPGFDRALQFQDFLGGLWQREEVVWNRDYFLPPQTKQKKMKK